MCFLKLILSVDFELIVGTLSNINVRKTTNFNTRACYVVAYLNSNVIWHVQRIDIQFFYQGCLSLEMIHKKKSIIARDPLRGQWSYGLWSTSCIQFSLNCSTFFLLYVSYFYMVIFLLNSWQQEFNYIKISWMQKKHSTNSVFTSFSFFLFQMGAC